MEILRAEEPLIVSLFEGLGLEASVSFHKHQFRTVLEGATDGKFIEYVNKDGKGKQLDDQKEED